MANSTIVIEAKSRSGSSVTARHSAIQGKKVYCVPGRIDDKTGKGTNKLIKKGAHILTDVNEILIELGVEKVQVKENKKQLLSETPMNIDKISRTLNINISQVNMKLTMMEIEGLVEVFPGNIIKIKEN